MDCLSKADFGDRLKTLPDGLDTPLYKELDKNGVEVSGGEAQYYVKEYAPRAADALSCVGMGGSPTVPPMPEGR